LFKNENGALERLEGILIFRKFIPRNKKWKEILQTLKKTFQTLQPSIL